MVVMLSGTVNEAILWHLLNALLAIVVALPEIETEDFPSGTNNKRVEDALYTHPSTEEYVLLPEETAIFVRFLLSSNAFKSILVTEEGIVIPLILVL